MKIVACPNPACGFRGYASIVGKPVILFSEYLFLLGAEAVPLDATSNEHMGREQWSADVAEQLVRRCRAVQTMLAPNMLPWDAYVIAGRRTAAQMVSIARRVEHDQRCMARRPAIRRRKVDCNWESRETTARRATVWRAFFIQMRRLQNTIDYLVDDPEFAVDAWFEWFRGYGGRVPLSSGAAFLATVLCSALRDEPASLRVRYDALEQVWTLSTGLPAASLGRTLETLAAAGCIELSSEMVKLMQRPVSSEALRMRRFGG
jgi:hypothetical protein